MNVLEALGNVLSTNRTIVYECRRCGMGVDSESSPCPHCEVDRIARYEIR